jgi:hypothetical protein
MPSSTTALGLGYEGEDSFGRMACKVRKKGLHIVTTIPSWHSSHYLAEANISNKERKVFKKKKKKKKRKEKLKLREIK